MTDSDLPPDTSTPEQRRAEAADWFERWREKVQAGLLPPARDLTDEEVNALVHELR